MALITLLHGSDKIIERPQLALGKPDNDYGCGFYCTEDEELAKEWACRNEGMGYVNRYRLNDKSLKILNLTDSSYSVLNWIAILLKNRNFNLNSAPAINARDYIIRNFAPDVSKYDIVIGYRADDSYFRYAKSFVQNSLPLSTLENAMMLGKLGLQTVLVSDKAFKQLEFVKAEAADGAVYHPKFAARDQKAREDFDAYLKNADMLVNELFVMDIIREGIGQGDARLQRTVSE